MPLTPACRRPRAATVRQGVQGRVDTGLPRAREPLPHLGAARCPSRLWGRSLLPTNREGGNEASRPCCPWGCQMPAGAAQPVWPQGSSAMSLHPWSLAGSGAQAWLHGSVRTRPKSRGVQGLPERGSRLRASRVLGTCGGKESRHSQPELGGDPLEAETHSGRTWL